MFFNIFSIESALYYNDVLNIFTNDYETLGDEEIVVEESNNSNLLVSTHSVLFTV